MPSKTTPSFAITTPPLTQEQLDALSHIAVAGSDAESSDSEIELEDPAVIAERQERRIRAFVQNPEAPWTPYSQRRRSVAAQATRDFDRVFEQRDPSPPRRTTR